MSYIIDTNKASYSKEISGIDHMEDDCQADDILKRDNQDACNGNKPQLLWMGSEIPGSTQPTNKDAVQHDGNPYPENELQFDFSQKDHSDHYFGKDKPSAVNCKIVQLPSKMATSSVSGHISSLKNLESKIQYGVSKSFNLRDRSLSANPSLMNIINRAPEPRTKQKEPTYRENKPVSLCNIIMPVGRNPSKIKEQSKPINQWILSNGLEEISQYDSMHVSTKVIKLDESNRQLEGHADLDPKELAKFADQARQHESRVPNLCAKPKSLLESDIDGESGIAEDVENEEMEIPCSSDEESEKMDHSIPESFDV